jgi:hypothetical protein
MLKHVYPVGMETSTQALKLEALREELRKPVKDFAERLLGQLASRIESISVVGSALTDDFVAGRSDINTVVIFGGDLAASLDTIASAGKGLGRKRIAPPLLLSNGYLRKSRDTFPIELLDFQLNHCTISGHDPFAALSFEKRDVRLQCERELRSILFRLSQGYVTSGAEAEAVASLLMASVTSMTTILRAMLWLKGIDRSGTFGQVFTKTAGAFGVDTDPLAAVRQWKASGRLPGKDLVGRTFMETYELVSRLTAAMDDIEV